MKELVKKETLQPSLLKIDPHTCGTWEFRLLFKIPRVWLPRYNSRNKECRVQRQLSIRFKRLHPVRTRNAGNFFYVQEYRLPQDIISIWLLSVSQSETILVSWFQHLESTGVGMVVYWYGLYSLYWAGIPGQWWSFVNKTGVPNEHNWPVKAELFFVGRSLDRKTRNSINRNSP